MFADNLASSLLHQLMAEKGSNQVDHMAFNISNITNPTVKIDTCSLGEKKYTVTISGAWHALAYILAASYLLL
jgi:hypothetical protein